MKKLPSKILPPQFNCIGSEPNNYYKINKINSSNKSHKSNQTLRHHPKGNPKVVSSVYGKIKTLVIFYPTSKEKEDKIYCYFDLLKELIQKLDGGGRTFMIITEHVLPEYILTKKQCKVLGDVAEKNGNRLCHIHIENENDSLSPWTQDAFLAVEYEYECKEGDKITMCKKTYLLEASNANEDDGVISEALEVLNRLNEEMTADSNCKECENLHFEYRDSDIPFVGGNILSGNDFVLIGLGDSHPNIENIGKKWLGENIILLHSDKINLGCRVEH